MHEMELNQKDHLSKKILEIKIKHAINLAKLTPKVVY